MIFIEDLSNLFSIFRATKTVLASYPEIIKPVGRHAYVPEPIFTMVSSFLDLEANNIIKDFPGDGIGALRALQSACARTTPQDVIRCEHLFSSTRMYATE